MYYDTKKPIYYNTKKLIYHDTGTLTKKGEKILNYIRDLAFKNHPIENIPGAIRHQQALFCYK